MDTSIISVNKQAYTALNSLIAIHNNNSYTNNTHLATIKIIIDIIYIDKEF